MKIAYADCFSGISGDMFLAALLDAGLPLDVLRADIGRLNLAEPVTLTTREVQKGSLRALKLDVETPHSRQPRFLRDVLKIVDGSSLEPAVKETSVKVFTLLAEAEARVIGLPVEKVDFHEVGLFNSIVDVVGAATGLNYLGIQRLYASPLPYGGGQIYGVHGLLPLPAPATLEIMRRAGMPLTPSETTFELVTPTGAAILAGLAVFERPRFNLNGLGAGAGHHDLPWPNVLRLMLGETEGEGAPGMVQIETNIDDMNPQMFGYVMEKLFAAGAADVYMVPMYMKKNRPATLLGVIARRQDEARLAQTILRETTSLGVRVLPLVRYEAQRRFEKVPTPFGEATIKIKLLDGRPVQAMPEYDECLRLAAECDAHLPDVYAAVLQAGRIWLEQAERSF
ncbi:MAG: nickel pincer cofactor biosynthesis protein LarC [Anaerolineae bacterium]|nr:nickel pincer cofactor biosynthesis protein LarC [Anaerolineae bacterium]